MVHNNWVLTAAHCCPDWIDEIEATFGDRLKNSFDSNEYTLNAVSWIQHGLYGDTRYCALKFFLLLMNSSDGTGSNQDWCMVKFNQDIIANDPDGLVAMPCLPTENPLPSLHGAACWLAGWGATSYGGQASSDLLHVTVPVVTEAYCKSVYGNYITDNMWCAGTNEGGKDSCQGDSGGPAVFRWPGGQFILGGVVSFGYKCAEPGIPGVYARVTQYTDWIYQNTGVWSDVSARYLQ